MREIVCIVCPNGCEMCVENDEVKGNKCPRGKAYALQEISHPTRTITTTVKTVFANQPVVSVKTDKAIDKEKIMDAMKEINRIVVDKPAEIGAVIANNICQSDVNIVLTQQVKGE